MLRSAPSFTYSTAVMNQYFLLKNTLLRFNMHAHTHTHTMAGLLLTFLNSLWGRMLHLLLAILTVSDTPPPHTHTYPVM